LATDVRNQSILVLIAALNEEQGIGPTIDDVKRHVPDSHILVVDGFSKDKTVEVARELGAQVVYRESSGKGDALAHAIANAKGNYDYVVFIDADYTYPAEFVPQMIETIKKNCRLGMVCGNRFNSHFRQEWMNNAFYVGNRILGFTHNLLNGVSMKDPLSGLRVVRWSIVKNWKPKSRGFDIEVEMNHQVERQGYIIQEIDISYRRRLGEKKLKVRHGFQILERMIVEVNPQLFYSS
jgi:glycosyltransferase involved in cell wall biosynthesis